MAKFCQNCGNELKETDTFCGNCGTSTNNIEGKNTSTSVNNANTNQKSKIAAGLFGIFLGCFGVHNFYLGYIGKAIAQLLITVLTCFIFSFVSAIWGLIEGILILAGNINTDADGNALSE